MYCRNLLQAAVKQKLVLIVTRMLVMHCWEHFIQDSSAEIYRLADVVYAIQVHRNNMFLLILFIQVQDARQHAVKEEQLLFRLSLERQYKDARELASGQYQAE
jgi:hypothetical protein